MNGTGSRLATLLILVVQLAGCAVYPASRVFYEPTASEGTLRNQTGCGYLHTHDTVERRLGDISLAVMVGSEKEPNARHAMLEVTLVIEGPTNSWNLSTEMVSLILNAPAATLRPSSSATQAGPGPTSNQQFIRWTLTFPEPAGLADKVEVSFEPGALSVRGKPIDVGPLHFNRVKRSDVYFASINC
jgi:hypothetical protein